MSSGVTLKTECVPIFTEMKLGHKYRYIIYSLTDDLKQIQVLKTAPPAANYDNFVEELKEAEEARKCRYGVFDAEYKLKDGQTRQKLVFFLWSPEGAAIKQKMIYTSSKDYLKKALVGIGKEIQACDYGDLDWTSVMEVLLRTEVAQ
jgi:hypothetical protein